MIDYAARQKYNEKQNQKNMMSEIFSNFSSQSQKTLSSLQQLHDKSLTSLVMEQKKQQDYSDRIGKAIAMIFNKIPEQIKLPDIFKIKGTVDIDSMPSINIDNLSDLRIYFDSLEKKIGQLTKQLEEQGKKTDKLTSISANVTNLDKLSPYFKSLESAIGSLAGFIAKIPPPKITLPEQAFHIPKIELPEINIPKYTPPAINLSLDEVVTELKNLQILLEKPETREDLLPVMRRIQAGIDNLASRPVMTPQPVTNVNINALQGFIKTTANTIGVTATQVPAYGQLFNRRALQIYNNSNNTIYYGGSDVTVTNGIPVTPGSFSNVIDAGYNMLVYAVASQGNNNIRVIEVSKDQTQNVQE